MGGESHTSLAAGDRLNDYELLCPIGEGGMAMVWIARLTRKRGFEKLVAIKTILARHAEDESFQEMFFDEARIASRIENPNVAHIHDLGEADGVVFLVMEYIDGHALAVLRKTMRREGKTVPIPIVARVMADACAGLAAAHDLKDHDGAPLGVVHRDVSPQNVLISTVGVSKVIDFGVAKAVNRLASRTGTGYVKGKAQYMAPEQALSKAVDHRADIWAVGAVLYTLIRGHYPFEAENHLALLSRLQREDSPEPLPKETPPSIAAIVTRALAHDPNHRFQTADELRIALEESGHIATHREVAQCLQEVLGPQTERRRRAINAARAEADARAATRLGIEDDPTTPNAQAPVVAAPPDDLAVTERKPKPPGRTPQLTVPLPNLPRAANRGRLPDMTARLPRVVVPPPERSSRPSWSSMVPIETPDLASRTGYGTNAGVASGDSYHFVAPPDPPPKKTLAPWLVVVAAALGVGLAVVAIALVLKAEEPTAEAPDAAAARIAPTPPPTQEEPVSAFVPETSVEAPPPPSASASASKVAPRRYVDNPNATEEARVALLRGDTDTVKKLLEPKVRAERATLEEANMLKQACKAAGDRPCVEQVKGHYPSL